MRFLLAPVIGFVTAVAAGIVIVVWTGLGERHTVIPQWMIWLGVTWLAAGISGWVAGRFCARQRWNWRDFVAIFLANPAIYNGCCAVSTPPHRLERTFLIRVLIYVSSTSVVLALAYSIGREGRTWKKKPGFCACDYDLTGNTSGVCPECGAAVCEDDMRNVNAVPLADAASAPPAQSRTQKPSPPPDAPKHKCGEPFEPPR